ncbi:hypothetical protein BABINDRAFT_10217 [Babjeviella inositovora NRRL Y-12698]|uniref:Peroxisomal hydratase-dehydrogenase-epimerase n=1 Tax=Babjeviella inositovora NRRL Y-12698 TaxID=984486 RepID=A0A1E3QHY9_9ASCO|nr:uncharacterized protein BABINDRAFT_10217 [Babjeviella inositovora NRRL Y-12698]ODQ77315.1 hypothetical protein BABINDRAFT_10217 [Babjeviella inositovora NRRL Y-12698]
MPLDFKDKVVIVTGAGSGLGKVYALDFAARGAKVVVNDLGGSLKGDGASSKNADIVVAEIKAAGGQAVANYDNVLDGANIVKTAVEAFGTVHVIINNAGILRDSAFKNMPEKDFKLVLDVHLNGAYKVTKAAWPYFRDQKYGRIVNTASPAGLYGNFGQANYATAKLALVGFAETLAKEGAKYNIRANVIAPLAKSRMTEDLLPPDVLEKILPEKVSPLVQYLAHADNQTSGAIFEVAGGFFGQVKWQRSSGQIFRGDEETFTPEAILNQFDSIMDFGEKPFNVKTSYPTQVSDYLSILEESKKVTKPNPQGNTKIDLTGKVVLITGAGAGLGRSHALWFARYGATVVVNDFKDPHSVVAEIIAKGGKALADKHDVVTQAPEIVKHVLDTYGRIDVLVNNAGILRDKSFLKMTDADWDLVINVHIIGTFNLCKLVWPVFVQQKFGRIINTTSTSGIYGSFGQANYAAAKCGIVSFSKTLAVEGKKNNILVNTIAPHAETAMTLTIFGEGELNKFPPSHVSPMVVLLASDQVPVTGETFEVGAAWVGNTRFQRAKGVVHLASDKSPFDIDWVAAHFAEAQDFSSGAVAIKSPAESSMAIMASLGGDEDDEDEEDEEDEESANEFYELSPRNIMLYNLGIGAQYDELKYVFEGSKDFQAIPSIGVIPAMVQCDDGYDLDSYLKNFNPMKLLHGEQYLKIKQWPIPTDAKLTTTAHPVQITQKGKNVVCVGGFDTIDKATGNPVFYNEMTTFIRDAQGESKVYSPRPAFATTSFDAPKRAPDYVVEKKTSDNQAALYRLSGDYNPLHIDPGFAKGGNFDKPILHGLCSFGVSAKALVDKFGNFEEAKLRFTSVVYPGETLKVEAWKEGKDVVIFRTTVVERNVIVINNAAVKILGNGSAKL